MKVLLLNGSPRKNGCTYTALNVVADALKAEGIDAEVFQAGDPDMENVKAAAAKLKDSDALVVGSPVYWASPSGQIIEFMDTHDLNAFFVFHYFFRCVSVYHVPVAG